MLHLLSLVQHSFLFFFLNNFHEVDCMYDKLYIFKVYNWRYLETHIYYMHTHSGRQSLRYFCYHPQLPMSFCNASWSSVLVPETADLCSVAEGWCALSRCLARCSHIHSFHSSLSGAFRASGPYLAPLLETFISPSH